MVVGLGLAVAVLSSSVQVRKESDSSVGTEIYFSGEGSNSNVDPVLVGGGEFLP